MTRCALCFCYTKAGAEAQDDDDITSRLNYCIPPKVHCSEWFAPPVGVGVFQYLCDCICNDMIYEHNLHCPTCVLHCVIFKNAEFLYLCFCICIAILVGLLHTASLTAVNNLPVTQMQWMGIDALGRNMPLQCLPPSFLRLDQKDNSYSEGHTKAMLPFYPMAFDNSL